jgi:hypothetical protein
MYIVIVLLMFVLPIMSIFSEIWFRGTGNIIFLIGKWFVFWAVGVRLFSAGLRQAITPRFTAKEIFEIEDDKPLQVVQELGFANISIGLLGICAVLNAGWIAPAALAGGLFYGLAGLRHSIEKEKNPLEKFVMLSDLLIFIILLIYLVNSTVR